jgi:hypothetical protein
MSDSSEVDRALIARLSGDSALHAVAPDGVFVDLAPQGSTRFVLIKREAHLDEAMQPGRTSHEVFTYLVKSVIQSPGTDDVETAAERIRALLHFQDFAIVGYSLMLSKRIEYVGFMELDQVNAAWQHRGGLYELWASPATP